MPRRRLFLLLLGLCGLAFAWTTFRRARADALVVYCAHDAVFAEKILRDFERATGVPVAVRFDTEATKSLGLVELLLRETATPRCDVFWNNEWLGTRRLADANLLLPYRGPGHARIPAEWKDAAARWTGFAARLRVWIVNTRALPAFNDAALERALAAPNLTRVALAKPLFGTTFTHYTALWDRWGPERTRAWHRDWRARGVTEAAGGNAAVKTLVASGVCDLGLTDTDDFFEAKDDGAPVAMLPVRLADGATIVIPNTVAILRSTRRLAAAQRLVDFLLSAETELALAKSGSRQIPLGPVADANALPPEVQTLRGELTRAYPLAQQPDAVAEACLTWLKAESGLAQAQR